MDWLLVLVGYLIGAILFFVIYRGRIKKFAIEFTNLDWFLLGMSSLFGWWFLLITRYVNKVRRRHKYKNMQRRDK